MVILNFIYFFYCSNMLFVWEVLFLLIILNIFNFVLNIIFFVSSRYVSFKSFVLMLMVEYDDVVEKRERRRFRII